MTIRARQGMVALVVTTAVATAFATGLVAARVMSSPVHPTLLSGADWAGFGFRGKQLYLSGFIAGAAAEQVHEDAIAAGDTTDSVAVSTGAMTALRTTGRLRYAYAPSVYASQIDDYYRWVDHAGTPIADVVISINRRMKDR